MSDTVDNSAGPQPAHSHGALLLLVTGATAIGMAAVFVRLAGRQGIGPFAIAFWRLALATPVFWAYLIASEGREAAVPLRSDLRILLLPGVFFALDLAIWHWSIKLTSVANATLFANCQPIVVAVGAWLLLRERFGRTFVLGLLCAMLGAAVVILTGASKGQQQIQGDVLGLLTAVCYGSYILSVRRARQRFSTARIMSYGLPIGCVLLMIASAVSGERFVPGTAAGWLLLVGLALLCQVGGQGLIAHALASLPASFSSVSLLVQPVAAALFAWLIVSEKLGGLQVAGGVLVLVGILLARRGSRIP